MKLKNILIFSTTVVLSAFNLACSSNLTSQSTAEVTRVVLDRDTKTSKRKTSSNKKKKKKRTTYETEIDYRYQVNGQTYEGYTEKDGDVQREFQQGAQVVVCYNPSNPEESDIFAAGYNCSD